MKRAIAILLIAFTILAFAETESPSLDFFSKAIGEAVVSYGYSPESYFYNPANITYFNSGGFTVFTPAFSYNQETWDLYDFYLSNKDRFESEEEDFDPLTDLEWEEVDELLSKDPMAQIQLPLNFLIITKPDKWGLQTLFGLNAKLHLTTDIERGIVPPISSSISGAVMGDIMVPFAIAGKLKIAGRQLRYGTTFKYIFREKVIFEKDLTPSVLSYVPVRYSGHGFGIDAGASYEINELITVGAALRNAGKMRYTWSGVKIDSEDTRTVTIDESATFTDADFSLGMTYFPKIKGLTKIIDNNFISLSFNDILAPKDYFLNHLKIGLGTRILKIFNFYLGLNGGYPSAGVDVDLWAFHLSYAFYSIELGKFPGQIRDSRHLMSISFSGIRRPQTKEEARRLLTVDKKSKKKKPEKKPGNLSKDKKKGSEPEKKDDELEKKRLAEEKIRLEQIEAQKRKAQELKLKEEQEKKRKEEELKIRKNEEIKKAEQDKIRQEAQKELEKLEVKEETAPEEVRSTPEKSEIKEEILEEKKTEIEEEILEETEVKAEEVVEEINSLNYKKGEKEVTVTLNIRFAPGSTTLPDTGKSDLYTLLNGLHKTKGHIYIRSYTDSSGSEESNLRYSQLRADEVRLFLVKNGIDPARITATGYGEIKPVADNSTKEGRAINRRIEVSFEVSN